MRLAGPYTRGAASPRDADENIVSAAHILYITYGLHTVGKRISTTYIARVRERKLEVHVL